MKSNAVLWFGVIGGPVAWALEFIAGYAFGLAQCEQPVIRWQLPVHGWQIALAAGAAVVALSAEAVALRIFFQTRDAESAPPVGRIHFLSVVGVTVNPLALAIIVMTGVGAPLLTLCQQS